MEPIIDINQLDEKYYDINREHSDKENSDKEEVFDHNEEFDFILEIDSLQIDLTSTINFIKNDLSKNKKIDNNSDAIIFGFLVGMVHSNNISINDTKLEKVNKNK